MTDEPRAARRRLPWWLAALVYTAATVALALAVTTFCVQPFIIPSSSMVPALAKGDRIVVQKWTYRVGEPERGDVVVFRDPGGWLGDLDEPSALQRGLRTVGLAPQGGYLVKRVAGDEVRCCDEGFVPAGSVVGRVWARVWPTARIGRLAPTDAFAEVPAP